MNICVDIWKHENEPKFLENVITCDESWFFQYDPETKRQSIALEKSQFAETKESKDEQVEIQCNDDCFFRYPRNCPHRLLPEGRTVNQVYYKEILITLR